jgi:hypothetical protein
MKIVLLFIVSVFLLASCNNEVIWKAGVEETFKVKLENYSEIDVNGLFDVVLVQDTLTFARFTCGENLFGRVSVSQKGDVVTCSELTDMNWTRTYKRTRMELHFKELNLLIINTCSDIVSESTIKSSLLSIWDNSDVSQLDLSVDCTTFKLAVSKNNFGIYKIAGVTRNSALELDGSAHFRTENLIADSCNVFHNGIGDCYVNATRILAGELSQNGRLYYKYYPELIITVDTRKGKITPF